jgi:hypothetical protein
MKAFIRCVLSVWMLCIAASVEASPITIGSFDPTRINCVGCDLPAGGSYTSLRAILGGRGDTVVSLPTLSAAALAGVDVFYTSLLNTGTGILSAAEQSALVTWVSNGGTLFTAGDISVWRPAYNSFLSPFGINETADAVGGVAVVTAGPNAITNGPNGSFASFNFVTGSIFGPGAYTTLATAAGSPFLIQQNVGLGQIVAVGDFNLFTDSLRGANELALFLNVLDSSAGAAPIPEPTAMLLLGTGLAGVLARRRRKQQAINQ